MHTNVDIKTQKLRQKKRPISYTFSTYCQFYVVLLHNLIKTNSTDKTNSA